MYLLFDIGGTNMRIATANNHRIIKTRTVATPQNFFQAMAAFREVARELAGNQSFEKAAGGVPGPLDLKLTKIVNAPNLPGWNGKPLKRALERITGCPVQIMKDVSAAVLGEAKFGAGKGKRIVAYYTVSTGVGGARSIDGRLDESTMLAEPGHQIVKYDDAFGHVEGLVSGTGLFRKHGKTANKINDKKIWSDSARFLALGIHNTIVHWQPDAVVIGGSIMKRLPISLVRKEVKRLLKIYKQCPEVVPAKLGDSVGLWGALAAIISIK